MNCDPREVQSMNKYFGKQIIFKISTPQPTISKNASSFDPRPGVAEDFFVQN